MRDIYIEREKGRDRQRAATECERDGGRERERKSEIDGRRGGQRREARDTESKIN